MTFHAKALELYTLAHQHVQDMSEEEMQEVRTQNLLPTVHTMYKGNTIIADLICG